MKNFYISVLSGALLFGAAAANAAEPTLTKDWSFVRQSSFIGEFEGYDGADPNWSATDVRSKMCIRFATAMNGKLYVVNQQTMSIAEVTETGEIKDLYKLPALTDVINGVADFYGCALTHDDAGNFLVGHYFTKPMSGYVWTIYQPSTGNYKHFVVDEAAPTAQRIDCVGRVVGDLTKFAAVYVGPTSTKDVNTQLNTAITFVNYEEDGNLDNVEASAVTSNGVYVASGNCSVAQPIFDAEKTREMWESDKIIDTFCYYSAAYGSSAVAGTTADYWSMGGYFVDGVFNSILPAQKFTYSGLTGFDTFVLGGKRYYTTYYVPADADGNIPAPYTDNKGAQSIGVFAEDGTLLASWNDTEWLANFAYSSLVAEVVDDETAVINSYLCAGAFGTGKYGENGIGGCKLTFKAGDAAGISDIIADEDADAPAVYYNLQGVEIANPENGIYIVRRGNKVSKEVL